jgi:hypothetical protein
MWVIRQLLKKLSCESNGCGYGIPPFFEARILGCLKYEFLGGGSVGDPPLALLVQKPVSSNNAVLSICFCGWAVNGD